MPIVNRIADLHANITEWRHDLQAHPELQYDVHRTAASVVEKLKAFGCDDVVAGIGKTGVVGVIKGRSNGSGRVIGLRADMDALPIEEATDVPYKSKTAGRPMDVEEKLGVFVEVAAPGGDLVGEIGNTIDDRHKKPLD